MDFAKTYSEIFKRFNESSLQYAVIGGFALHFWGYSRLTHDLDFIILADDKNKARQCLSELGFKPYAETEFVAHYENGEGKRVDFIFARRIHGVKIIERAQTKEYLGLQLKVARAEDIIGLKVQSLANNPLRWLKDMADIEALMLENKGSLDLDLIGDYFRLFKLDKEWEELKRRSDASVG